VLAPVRWPANRSAIPMNLFVDRGLASVCQTLMDSRWRGVPAFDGRSPTGCLTHISPDATHPGDLGSEDPP